MCDTDMRDPNGEFLMAMLLGGAAVLLIAATILAARWALRALPGSRRSTPPTLDPVAVHAPTPSATWRAVRQPAGEAAVACVATT